jgi:predicted Zn-dependent peptidase
VVDMLADTVLRPKFLPWELEEEKGAVKAELDAAANNPQVPQPVPRPPTPSVTSPFRP